MCKRTVCQDRISGNMLQYQHTNPTELKAMVGTYGTLHISHTSDKVPYITFTVYQVYKLINSI